MKRLVFVFTCASLVMLLSAPVHGATEITLDQVDQVGIVHSGDTVFAVDPVRFTFRLTNTDGDAITGVYNAFRVWAHRNGMYTDNFVPLDYDTLSVGWRLMLSGGFFMGCSSFDGIGADTVRFAGYDHPATPNGGIPNGFDEQVWWIEIADLVAGDTICVDSSYCHPGCAWEWETEYSSYFQPDWYGPYCFVVTLCCIGNQGNVDLQGSVNIADLTLLVGYLFSPHWDLPCTGAGNVNGDGRINITDVTYLVRYLFKGGPPPAPCP